uniref:Uncharacterized protein n=1 Tax=Ascaris lumbricoides TaxID=6252 RepID=A0A0M3IAN5_ASCLU
MSIMGYPQVGISFQDCFSGIPCFQRTTILYQ